MDSKITLHVAKEEGRSRLKESYHNAPYKLTHYGAPNLTDHLEMIIMSASPGIMDTDHLHIDVHVRREAHLKLFTQSFNKLHPMKTGASQHTDVHVAEGGIFHYIPHPVTPFKDSIFKATNQIHLAGDAVLMWGDIISVGRIHMKEAFEFERLHTQTKIFRAGKLAFIDNQLLIPKEQPIQKMLFFEGYTHQATFLFSAVFAQELKAELDEILTVEYNDISYGFTLASPEVIILRALGSDGELLYDFLHMLGQLCWDFTMHKRSESKDAVAEEGNPAPLPIVAEADAVKEKRKKTPPRPGAGKIKEEKLKYA
ncbi:urease accessory protein UreD [Sphingobacterium sp. InxBP1]|uniref:urease accessory protein UreD n=1 Tax=Sphingobacterium sp. InxBP1 TaxID=2870328 RepID=UPI0022441F9F|nr:urease accessory protein UreD [Sphingobacterium sp. InxBP1]MCW8310375.1 urease accessory protein UreD [Sphingobacterium sp. InxBP1]